MTFEDLEIGDYFTFKEYSGAPIFKKINSGKNSRAYSGEIKSLGCLCIKSNSHMVGDRYWCPFDEKVYLLTNEEKAKLL